ncbi:1-phosphofructokinase [Planifilum fulgidum]|jgi:1-phosphofructokinase|uniref:Tagatose-6-phosphate kinase n=1 Tax=Planifilum fulgidum TaxID=201973 RepID=A0A1I2SSY1_9BACL|nr:1-phosphofructokinase [Planifilum fulgidum]MBO2495439.1 1-phosphofructokinase [Bacillota bacterium]MBO2531800.1 1-phosphofructokinase [Thermoactinomycetaceae bacterium]SFG54989.1 1-phosphofructokinase [Planifilum fulgidum]
MGKIVTVTLNPAVDKTIHLPRLRPGDLNRAGRVRRDPGGKGINVARALKLWGETPLAIGWVGGYHGRWILRRLEEWGIEHRFVELDAETRTNLKIVEEADDRVTDINEPGDPVDEEAIARFLDVYDAAIERAEIAVLSGSLPPGAPEDFYGILIDRAKRRSVKVYLDADGEALREGVRRGPYAVKPNLAELERLVGRSLTDEEDRFAAAKGLLDRGIRLVALSMGAEGAWFFAEGKAIRARAPRVSVSSTVGAGDAMVAALVLGERRKWPLDEALRFVVAAASATASKEGTQFAALEEAHLLLDQVELSCRSMISC